MKMPNTKYTGSFLKSDMQGSSGPVHLRNKNLAKYYGKMIDAPGFKKLVVLRGGQEKQKAKILKVD